jgi:signal transduction histidine kinase/CheY-like chemotaxis protein
MSIPFFGRAAGKQRVSGLSSLPHVDVASQISRERMEVAWRQATRTIPGLAAAGMGALWMWAATDRLALGSLWILACLLQTGLMWLAARRYLRLDEAERRRHYRAFWWSNTIGGLLHGALCTTFAWSVIPGLDPPARASASVALLVLGGWLASTGSLLRVGFLFSALLPTSSLCLIWWPGAPADAAGAVVVLMFGLALVWMHREQELLLQRSVLAQMRNAMLMREALQRSQLIESINKKKTEIIAAASHDLRQPVHALGLLVQRLHPNLGEADQLVLFHQVRSRVAVISEMLAGLLDLSKFDSGSYKVRLETVRLTDVVEEVVGLFEDRAHRKSLRLRHEVEDVDIQTDAALLKQIIHNLISNAIKYTAKGEVAIVGGYGGAGSFLLQVRDTGIGIPRGNLDEIFMEYFRLPVHRNGSEDGLGIGLALVKRACSLLSYRVHVKSIVGGGSRFTLEIPAMRVAPHRRQVDLLPADTVPGDSAGNQEHCILLLENDEVAHDAMVRLVSDWGYRVIANTDGERMLQRLRTDPALRPDLIVSDMHLGGPKDGVQYIEAIREIMGTPRLPGLVVTGDLGRELQERAAKKGIRILYKPLQPRILKAAIRGVLRSPG